MGTAQLCTRQLAKESACPTSDKASVAHLAKASKDTDKGCEEDVQQEALSFCNSVVAGLEEERS